MAEEKSITINNYYSKSFESFDSLSSRKYHKKSILRSNPVYYIFSILYEVTVNSFKDVSGRLLEQTYAKNLRRIGVPFSAEQQILTFSKSS
jgi:hypothetical protein